VSGRVGVLHCKIFDQPPLTRLETLKNQSLAMM
jgi:hypothetical protein